MLQPSPPWVLRVQEAGKRYGPVVLFQGLNLDIGPSTAQHILGPNGSGKTQFLRALCGLVALDQGRVLLRNGKGWRALPGNPYGRDRYLRYVPATLGELASLPIAEFVAVLSRRLQSFSLGSRHAAVRRHFQELSPRLEQLLGRQLDARMPVSHLSIGQQKRLCLGAIMEDPVAPCALAVDEPLAGLDRRGIEAMLSQLRQAKNRGIALLVAEHRPQIEGISFEGCIEMPFGVEKGNCAMPAFGLTGDLPQLRSADSETCLHLRGVTAGYRGTEVGCENLVLKERQVAVITGSNGTGKTGFLMGLIGKRPCVLSGTVEFEGVVALDLRTAMRTGKVRYMSQDRESFPSLSVSDALRVAEMARTIGAFELEQVAALIGSRKLVASLSSGSLALLCVAQTLACRPRLALLDEPLANVDVTNRVYIHRLIQLARQEWATAFLIVEHASIVIADAHQYNVEIHDGLGAVLERYIP